MSMDDIFYNNELINGNNLSGEDEFEIELTTPFEPTVPEVDTILEGSSIAWKNYEANFKSFIFNSKNAEIALFRNYKKDQMKLFRSFQKLGAKKKGTHDTTTTISRKHLIIKKILESNCQFEKRIRKMENTMNKVSKTYNEKKLIREESLAASEL